MATSPKIVESEKDSNYLHENMSDEALRQGLEFDEPVNDGFAQKKVHRFYFVKFWPYEDESLCYRIVDARKLIEKINREAVSATETYRTKRYFERDRLSYELDYLLSEKSIIREALARKTQTTDRLLEARDKLNLPKNYARHMLHKSKNLTTEREVLRQIKETQESEAVDPLISSVEELSEFIGWLYNCMRWQCNVRDEQILHGIQQLEQGSKNPVQDQIRIIKKVSEEITKKGFKVGTEIKGIKRNLEKDRDSSMKQLQRLRLRQNKVKRDILQLTKQLDEKNSGYDRYVSVISNAQELARKKDVKALKELSLQEVDTFMSKWNESEAFRCNYERSILPSLKNRRLGRDGSTRNVNEQPLNLKAPIFNKFTTTSDEMVARMSCILNLIENFEETIKEF